MKHLSWPVMVAAVAAFTTLAPGALTPASAVAAAPMLAATPATGAAGVLPADYQIGRGGPAGAGRIPSRPARGVRRPLPPGTVHRPPLRRHGAHWAGPRPYYRPPVRVWRPPVPIYRPPVRAWARPWSAYPATYLAPIAPCARRVVRVRRNGRIVTTRVHCAPVIYGPTFYGGRYVPF